MGNKKIIYNHKFISDDLFLTSTRFLLLIFLIQISNTYFNALTIWRLLAGPASRLTSKPALRKALLTSPFEL